MNRVFWVGGRAYRSVPIVSSYGRRGRWLVRLASSTLGTALSALLLLTYVVAAGHGYAAVLELNGVGEWGAEVAVLVVALATSAASVGLSVAEDAP